MKGTWAIIVGLLAGLLTALVITAFAAGVWWAMTMNEGIDHVANAAAWFVGGFIYGGAVLVGFFTAWRDPIHPFRSAAIAGVVITLAHVAFMPYMTASWPLMLAFMASYGLIPVACALAGATIRQALRPGRTAPE